MKPGPHPWATNDTYVAGPDIGSDSKTETLALQREDGMARSRRPAPDIFNWQQNRNALTQQSLAKLWASNYTLEYTSGAGMNANYEFDAACVIGSTSAGGVDNESVFAFFFDQVAQAIYERQGIQGKDWVTPGSNPVMAAAGVVISLDAAGDDVANKVVCAQTTLNNIVRYSPSTLALAWQPSVVVGPAKVGWLSIGCDADSAAVGNARWTMGNDGNDGGGAGTAAPVVYASVDGGATFNAVGTFPGLAIGQQIRCVEHSRHPVGALGPDDPGNPTWLVLSDLRAVRSTNGTAWTDAAHGLGAVPNNNSLAYSRTSRRWVWPIGDLAAPGDGDIAYSDDNGATWVTLPGVLVDSQGGSLNMKITGDGYGTFVVIDDSAAADDMRTYFWVSTDEGITWTRGETANLWTVVGQSMQVVCSSNSLDNWSETGTYPSYFSLMRYRNTPLLEVARSLVF